MHDHIKNKQTVVSENIIIVHLYLPTKLTYLQSGVVQLYSYQIYQQIRNP